jgi:hypothetical protein
MRIFVADHGTKLKEARAGATKLFRSKHSEVEMQEGITYLPEMAYANAIPLLLQS